MRNNLIAMLDGIDIPRRLVAQGAEVLFDRLDVEMHTTSAIRYPTSDLSPRTPGQEGRRGPSQGVRRMMGRGRLVSCLSAG